MRLTCCSEKRLDEAILSRGARMTYKAGTILFSNDEQAGKAYYLEKGLVKFSIVSKDGNQSSLLYITAGSIFGEYGLLINIYGATAIAVMDCEVVSFTREQFRTLLNEDPGFALLCINSLTEKLWWVGEQLKSTCFMNRFGKIANGLLRLARRWGEPISLLDSNNNLTKGLRLRITHQELAEFTGTNRSTVTTVLDAFEAENIIQKRAKEIIIISLEELEHWAV